MAVLSKLYKCEVCSHEMIDQGQASVHFRKCKEFGGPVDRRSKLFKKAKEVSIAIDGTHKHTYKELIRLKEIDEKNVNITINNITNIQQTAENITNISNQQINNNTVFVTFNSGNGEKRVNDLDSPNLSYLHDYITKWIDDRFPKLKERDDTDDEDYGEKKKKKATCLSEFAHEIAELVISIHNKTYFDKDHPENHSIRVKNKNRPNTSLEYIKDGKWHSINKDELYSACYDLCRHNMQKILRDSSLYRMDDNIKEIVNYEPEDAEEEAFKEHSIQGIERTTVKGGVGRLQLVDPKEAEELVAFNRERIRRMERGERCDNLDSDEEKEVWAAARAQLQRDKMKNYIVKCG